MLIFSIIIYTLFGGMCIWFIISGVQKIKQIIFIYIIIRKAVVDYVHIVAERAAKIASADENRARRPVRIVEQGEFLKSFYLHFCSENGKSRSKQEP